MSGKRGLMTRQSRRVFSHPVNDPGALGTNYRRWRLCLRSEAPNLFLPISALLLNGPYGRLPSRAQIISSDSQSI